MAFLDQLERLTREKWADINTFAEELKLILKQFAQTPMKFKGPSLTTMEQRAVGESADAPVEEFTDPQGNKTLLYPNGSFTTTPSPTLESPSPAATATTSTGAGSSGSGGLIGTIVSGTGSSYTVKLSTGTTVSVTHPQIDAGETIQVGRTVAVYTGSSGFVILEPTWL